MNDQINTAAEVAEADAMPRRLRSILMAASAEMSAQMGLQENLPKRRAQQSGPMSA